MTIDIDDIVVIDNDINSTDICKVLWVGKILARVSINGHPVNLSKDRLEKKKADGST